FGFTINVTDGSHTASRQFNVSIYPAGGGPALFMSLGNFGPFAIGVVTIQLSASGGSAPYHYLLTPGATPIPGMRVQEGQPLPTFFPSSVTAGYIGVITTAGVYPTSIRVTDANGATFDAPITITVQSTILFSQFALPKATV